MESKLEKFRLDWFTTGRETQQRTTPLNGFLKPGPKTFLTEKF